jgi:hypothetical protein
VDELITGVGVMDPLAGYASPTGALLHVLNPPAYHNTPDHTK